MPEVRRFSFPRAGSLTPAPLSASGDRRHYRCTGHDDERLAFEARSMLICRKINGCHGSFRFGQSSLASSNSQLIEDQPACWNVDHVAPLPEPFDVC